MPGRLYAVKPQSSATRPTLPYGRLRPVVLQFARRVSEGESERDAVRCLKRYLARSLYRQLEATPTTGWQT